MNLSNAYLTEIEFAVWLTRVSRPTDNSTLDEQHLTELRLQLAPRICELQVANRVIMGLVPQPGAEACDHLRVAAADYSVVSKALQHVPKGSVAMVLLEEICRHMMEVMQAIDVEGKLGGLIDKDVASAAKTTPIPQLKDTDVELTPKPLRIRRPKDLGLDVPLRDTVEWRELGIPALEDAAKPPFFKRGEEGGVSLARDGERCRYFHGRARKVEKKVGQGGEGKEKEKEKGMEILKEEERGIEDRVLALRQKMRDFMKERGVE